MTTETTKESTTIEYRFKDYIFNITCREDGDLKIDALHCKTRPGWTGKLLNDIRNFQYDIEAVFRECFDTDYQIKVEDTYVEYSSLVGNRFSVRMTVKDSNRNVQEHSYIAANTLNILIDSGLLPIQDTLVLTEEDAKKFLDLLENPPEPNEKLLKAVEDWKKYCSGGDCGCL